jgi:hypothetical protein
MAEATALSETAMAVASASRGREGKTVHESTPLDGISGMRSPSRVAYAPPVQTNGQCN